MNNATSKVDVRKTFTTTSSTQTRRSFQKQGASKFPIHSQDKVNRVLKNLKQNKIISPINKKQQSKGSTYEI